MVKSRKQRKPKKRSTSRKLIKLEPTFPEPVAQLGGRNRWKLGAVRRYIADVAGDPVPERRPDDDFLVGSAELRRMLGNVSLMWIFRRRAKRAEQAAAAPA
jgi:hypothetical protein